MKKTSYLFLIVGLLSSISALAIDVGLTYYKPDPKVQNQAGTEDDDPYSPGISIGHTWQFAESWAFAPRIGYIKNQVNSDDRYATYKIETYTFLYDFLYNTFNSNHWALRMGIGSFNQKISGDGGTVTVPNGSGTATAYKPGAESRSATGTLNLGVDFKFDLSTQSFIEDYGINFELFYFDPLKKSFYAYQISALAYF